PQFTSTPPYTSTSTPTYTWIPTVNATPTSTWTPTLNATPTRTTTPLPIMGVRGTIHYYSNWQGVNGAAVQAQSSSSGGGSTASAVLTDSTGLFSFADLGSGNWQIQPQKIEAGANPAVSTLDAVYIL